MIPKDGQILTVRRACLALVAMLLVAVPGCGSETETVWRDRLEKWFPIGETIAFSGGAGCLAASFRLVDFRMNSSLVIEDSVPAALRTLSRRGAVALKNPDQAPDAALMAFVEADWTIGTRMRLAALEGRQCMSAQIESAFHYALANPRSILAYDTRDATLMLMDPHTGLLVVTRGAQEWL